MDRKELLETHKKISNHCLEIMKVKNEDYAGDEQSPFLNFEACEDIGICKTEKGMLVRLLDKIRRIINFVDKGELQVKDEPVQDAIYDSINYLILLFAYIESKKDE